MRITGNEKLDPDFSKIKKKKVTLGHIWSEDLYDKEASERRIGRVDQICENCKKEGKYEITMSSRPLFGFFEPIRQSKEYHIACMECGETVELEYSEFLKVKGFIRK